MPSSSAYALVYNIPEGMRSRHLRKFFRVAIERNYFKCFHYRHRKSSTLASRKLKLEPKTCACLVKMASLDALKILMSGYHNSKWITDKSQLCAIEPISTTDEDHEDVESISSTIDVDNKIAKKHLKRLAELRPPRFLKKGNVGTPVAYLLTEIRHCRMPSSLLTKLGVNLQEECYKRKYFCFSWDYELSVGSRCHATSVYKKDEANENTFDPYELDEPAEEWERHEALHDDPFKLVPKERLFESEKEVVWEKGSSGLVWYTDAQYWDSLEGNDEKETDDWDVIPHEMDDEPEPTNKVIESRDFEHLKAKKKRRRKHARSELEDGFGGKLLKRFGWKTGQGLGAKNKGIAEAIPNDGQNPHDKRGFGYRGQKLFNFRIPEKDS